MERQRRTPFLRVGVQPSALEVQRHRRQRLGAFLSVHRLSRWRQGLGKVVSKARRPLLVRTLSRRRRSPAQAERGRAVSRSRQPLLVSAPSRPQRSAARVMRGRGTCSARPKWAVLLERFHQHRGQEGSVGLPLPLSLQHQRLDRASRPPPQQAAGSPLGPTLLLQAETVLHLARCLPEQRHLSVLQLQRRQPALVSALERPRVPLRRSGQARLALV